MSAKSSIISGKSASLEKTVKKNAKAITWPSKKIKQSLSIHLETHLTTSHSSIAIITSNNDANGDNAKSVVDIGSAHGSSESKVDLVCEQELG